jgi:FkbM family methyltransferase
MGVSQVERMTYWKNEGFDPEGILDVGANRGEWTKQMMAVFPKAQFLMLEANERHRETLKKVGSPFWIGPVGDIDQRPVTFYSSKQFARAHTGASLFPEVGMHGRGNPNFAGVDLVKETVTMRTIDSIVSQLGVHVPFHMVKADVQGAEILALKGARTVLRKAAFVLLEVSVRSCVS